MSAISAPRPPADVDSSSDLLTEYRRVRDHSEQIAAPLAPEDCVIQSMPDVSPTRWHLAHTTWFFETFILKQDPQYQPFDSRFEFLFNSYYNTVGEQFPRAQRGLISRPTLAEIRDYRRSIDQATERHLDSGTVPAETLAVVALGLQHEQQHQELMLTDIKHVLSCNPLWPTYIERPLATITEVPAQWRDFDNGVREIGDAGGGFAFDNESPRHRVYLERFSLADALVTAGQFLEFIEDGGYQRPELWLSLGWQAVQDYGWRAPLYWHREGDRWWQFTLGGRLPLETALPVCHVSYFEADAFARWAGARLPTEAEWEVAAENCPVPDHFDFDPLAKDFAIHPSQSLPGRDDPPPLRRMFGDVWQWTSSSYAPYPGYAAPDGALGEYNGKFMCNQYVLRGSSCATPPGHARATYRNFFPPDARWQFTGIRLARGATRSDELSRIS